MREIDLSLESDGLTDRETANDRESYYLLLIITSGVVILQNGKFYRATLLNAKKM